MKLLLDTHVLIWSGYKLPSLSRRAKALINSTDNTLLFSAASIWELAIKQSLGRDRFEFDAAELRRGLLANDYEELDISSEHGIAAAFLPKVHSDPFDRLLVAQARIEGANLLTVDRRLLEYGDFVLRA